MGRKHLAVSAQRFLASILMVFLLVGCQSIAPNTPTTTVTPVITATEASPANPVRTATEVAVSTPNAPMTDTPTMSPATDSEDMKSLYPPVPADDQLSRGNFFVDTVELVASSDGKMQLVVQGSLPTPCNDPRADIQPPDQDNQIIVEVYSVVQKDKICTQVLKPFSGPVAILDGYTPGTYTVIVNDQETGEFDIP